MTLNLLTYGPNTALVERFFSRLEAVPVRDWLEAVRAMREVPADEWRRADAAAHLVIDERGLRAAYDRAAARADRACAVPLWLLETSPATAGVRPQNVVATVASGATALLLRGIAPPTIVRALYQPWADILPMHELETP